MSMENQSSENAYLLPNGGWDERILAFQYKTLVTCHAIISERYVVLLDTMINPQTARDMMVHAAPYLEGGRQLLVVNTHTDWDHCWGNQIFVGDSAEFPAPIIASRACADQFMIPGAAKFLAEMAEKQPDVFGDVRLVPPTLAFDERLTIDGGDLTIELFMSPGHTHDLISVWVPEIKTLFATDSAERPFPEPRKPDFMQQMRDTLHDLAAYDAETVLYCHAADVDGTVIRDNIAYFDFVEGKCREAISAEITLPSDESVDLAALINCPFAAAMPATPDLTTTPLAASLEYYKTKGHNSNIRAVWINLL